MVARHLRTLLMKGAFSRSSVPKGTAPPAPPQAGHSSILHTFLKPAQPQLYWEGCDLSPLDMTGSEKWGLWELRADASDRGIFLKKDA